MFFSQLLCHDAAFNMGNITGWTRSQNPTGVTVIFFIPLHQVMNVFFFLPFFLWCLYFLWLSCVFFSSYVRRFKEWSCFFCVRELLPLTLKWTLNWQLTSVIWLRRYKPLKKKDVLLSGVRAHCVCTRFKKKKHTYVDKYVYKNSWSNARSWSCLRLHNRTDFGDKRFRHPR